MEKKTNKKLIKQSALKWWGILKQYKTDKGTADCPLCREYLDNWCLNCPIALEVQSTRCRCTPYTKWYEYQEKKDDKDSGGGGYWAVFNGKSYEFAREEFLFLCKLFRTYSKCL